jgi:hypothetical protein
MKKHRQKVGSGEVGQFDQRNTMFSRPKDHQRSNSEVLEMGKKHYGVRSFKDNKGLTLSASWTHEQSIFSYFNISSFLFLIFVFPLG